MAKAKLLGLEQVVNFLRASGEDTRLRLIYLLSNGDLTVTDLVEILGQSQPRVSRHLKLLMDAGMLQRYQEGAWAYYRLIDSGPNASLLDTMIAHIDAEDSRLARDRDRLKALREKRSQKASAFFAEAAESWDRIRTLYADESKVEAEMLDLVGSQKFQSMLDIGTGTGRMLEVFADHYVQAVGMDASREMLSVARSNLDNAGLSRVQTRQGNIYMLPTPPNSFDFVSIHQVLHYLDDPAEAIAEACKALAPSGRLLIVDFAPHKLEYLREEQSHLRLGFSQEQMEDWLKASNLKLLETREIKTTKEVGKDSLTVCIWLATDQRTELV